MSNSVADLAVPLDDRRVSELIRVSGGYDMAVPVGMSEQEGSLVGPARKRVEFTGALEHPLVRRAYPPGFVDACFGA